MRQRNVGNGNPFSSHDDKGREKLVEHDAAPLNISIPAESCPDPRYGSAYKGGCGILTLNLKGFRYFLLKTQIQGDSYSMGTQLCFCTAPETCTDQ